MLARYGCWSFCACLLAVTAISAPVTPAQGPPVARDVTYADDVADIIQSRCVPCHRPGGDAPFSLASLAEVRRRASTIVSVTRSRYMPPWKPVEGFGDFQGSRRMRAGEIAIIEQWVASGMPEGRGHADARPAPAFGWPMGAPDVVLRLPTYALRAGGPDVFRNFVVPVTGAHYVRALQFKPGNRAVHHANIRVDATPASRRLDEADPAPGYEGLIARSADFPDGHFLGWTPGQVGPTPSDALSWFLKDGSDLVVQLHLRPSGKVEDVAPTIGLYFGTRAPESIPSLIRLGRQDLSVPPGESHHVVRDSFVLPVDADVRAVQPHAHYRARSLEAWASLPDGSRRPLIRIDDWDMNWQDRYLYAAPFWLPAGTHLILEYVFDNSTANPRNPDRPPARADWGWRSIDEMADLWIQVMTRTDSDRARLRRDAGFKMQHEDAIGNEVLLRREPDHVNLRNDAAALYLTLGEPAKALAHFEVVTRLQPASAPAWFNEGVALEALGRRDEARQRYAEAVRISSSYSPAHNNLGVLLLRDGRVAEARAVFERAIAADPENADARANLALVMAADSATDAALTQIHYALQIKPDLLTGLTPVVWLLAAHPDAGARRPAEARRLAERIVAATSRRDPAALDALAACLAGIGSFDDAIRTAGAAEAATPASAPELLAAIRARIALYRAGRTFVLPR